MKRVSPLMMVAAVIVLAVGCAGSSHQIKIPKDAARMEIQFSWEGVEACDSESPPIRVSNVPDGTDALQVRLTDMDMPQWNHGGGRLKHDGSGIIPAGALQLGYNGPCPPGVRHTYEFSVMAVDADGTILGFGKARQPFPPKN